MTVGSSKQRAGHLAAAGIVVGLAVAAVVVVGNLRPHETSRVPGAAVGPAASFGFVLAALPARKVVETGVASWYGAELAGAKTASGEPFDPEALTAAHPELPFGTAVTVVNLENGRAVEVVINDRGPFTGGRVIDVSAAAARKLGFKEDGTAEVQLEVAPEVLATLGAAEA